MIIAAAQSASIPGDIAHNAAHHLRFAAIAAEHGAQLLIFPELSLTGYELAIGRSKALRPNSPVFDPLREMASQSQMTIVAGGPLLNEGGELHIASFILDPDGSISTYTKKHVHESEQPFFTSGPGGAPLCIGNRTVALAICADVSHPSHAADSAAGGAKVYAASVMVDEVGYARKASLLEQYAREHQMTVLMANYSGLTGGDVSAGNSAIWSEDGKIVAITKNTEEALVIGVEENGLWKGKLVPLPSFAVNTQGVSAWENRQTL